MHILTLESSTTSAKAMLYCPDTGQIDVATEEYRQEDLIGGNLNPENVFLQTVALGKKLCAGKDVAIIALCSAWHSVFLCDQQMHPLTGVYNWTSPVASDLCAKKREDEAYVQDYYRRTGCMVNAIYPSFKLMYLKSLGFDLQTCTIFGQGSYNTYRLVGKRVVTDCMVSGAGLLNVHVKQYDKAILDEIGIGPKQLCKIVTYDHTYPLTQEGAEFLGLKSGTPVIVACSDGGYNQIGIGAQSEGLMSFSVGTSAAIRLTVNKPLLPDPPSTWCYMSPTGWMSGAATSGACSCTAWFKESFLQGENYQEIEAVCQERTDAPVFLPFVFGERCPGWKDDAKGIFTCIQPAHDKYDLYCAVLEGVLFNIYHCYRILKEHNNDLTPRIILSGGILNSPMWTQMCADIFQTDLEIPENEQSSLLGGIVLGMELLGLKEQTAQLFQKNRIVKTNPLRHPYYYEKFEQYLFWYNKLI